MEVQIGTTSFGALIESTKADHMPPSNLPVAILSIYSPEKLYQKYALEYYYVYYN